MFNRTYFFVGLLTGAAAVGAYTVSCDATRPASSSGTTVTPGASEVPYANAHSGLNATTVQAAIDEIGTTMRTATAGAGVVTGGGATTTIWTIQMNLLDVTAETMTSTSMGTVTLTETAPGQGSYETSGANIFILDGLAGAPIGTRTGKYFIVGDWVLLTGERAPGAKIGITWNARQAEGGRKLTLSNGGSVILVLSKQ